MREENLRNFTIDLESLMAQYNIRGVMCGMNFKDGKIVSGENPGELVMVRNVFDNTDMLPPMETIDLHLFQGAKL